MNAKRLAGLLVLALMMLTSATGLADSNKGTITIYHLNEEISGRGPCIQMSPSLPGKGWACLWKDNGLYEEINRLLLEAYMQQKKNCVISWRTTDPSGHPMIVWAECRF